MKSGSAPVRVLVFSALVVLNGWFQIGRRDLVYNDGVADGIEYVRLAIDPAQAIASGELNRDRVHRMSSSLVVHAALRLASVPRTTPNIVLAFSILNLLWVLGTALIWLKLSRLLGLSGYVVWLGLVTICFNVHFAKFIYYHPTNVDAATLFFAMLALFGYFKRSTPVLLAALGGGMMTMVTFPFIVLPLVVFPRREEEVGTGAPRAASMFVAVVCLTYSVLAFVAGRKSDPTRAIALFHPVNQQLLVLSVLSSALFLALSLRPLFNTRQLFDVPGYLPRISWMPALASLAIVLGFTFVVLQFKAYTRWNVVDVFWLSDGVLARSVTSPFIVPISHVSFFGPIALAALALWPRICRVVHQYGIGLTISLSLAILMLLNSESRHQLAAFPAFAVLTLMAINRLDIGPVFKGVLIAAAILHSRFWMFYGSWEKAVLEPRWNPVDITIGIYMPTRMIVVQVVTYVILSLCLVLALMLDNSRRRRMSPAAILSGTGASDGR